MPKIMTLEERFWSHVQKSDGCWLWTGHCQSKGYGQLSAAGSIILAHRYSYSMHNGNIPSGLVVCHRCDNPKCVNPDHLFVGTQKDNIHDMLRKGRGAHQAKSKKALGLCRHGHEMTEDNQYIAQNGQVNCRTCNLVSKSRYAAKHAANKKLI